MYYPSHNFLIIIIFIYLLRFVGFFISSHLCVSDNTVHHQMCSRERSLYYEDTPIYKQLKIHTHAYQHVTYRYKRIFNTTRKHVIIQSLCCQCCIAVWGGNFFHLYSCQGITQIILLRKIDAGSIKWTVCYYIVLMNEHNH